MTDKGTYYINTKEDYDRMVAETRPHAGKAPFKVVFARSKTTRSVAQNNYYWSVIVGKLVSYFLLNPLKFVNYVLCIGIRKEFIHTWLKMKYKIDSTADLSTKEFNESIEEIIADMKIDLNLDIPLPNEKELLSSYEDYLKTKGE